MTPLTLVGEDKKFDVALTFAGDHRVFIEKLATCLAQDIGREQVFYDNWCDLNITDLDLTLQSIYSQRSKLIAIFTCAQYENRKWCGLEFRAIRNLIYNFRDNGKKQSIMIFRFDNTNVPGILDVDGYTDCDNKQPSEIGSMIIQRLNSLKLKESSNLVSGSLPLNLLEENEFAFEKGKISDYENLKELIVKKKWIEADRLTVKIICKIVDRKENQLRREDIENIEIFPPTDLKTIDNLWENNSGRKFGFSVQKEIWNSFNNPKKIGFQWNQFIKKIGWNNANLQNYSESSIPKGYFPRQLKWVKFHVIASRL